MTRLDVANALAAVLREIVVAAGYTAEDVVVSERMGEALSSPPAVAVNILSFEFLPFGGSIEYLWDGGSWQTAPWTTPDGFFIENKSRNMALIFAR
jgi:hypothetical protein